MQKETNYVGSGRTMTFSWGTKQCLSIKKANFDLLPVDKYGNVKIDVVVRNRHDNLIEFKHDQIFVWREVIERT
jgi:hypothetical protein